MNNPQPSPLEKTLLTGTVTFLFIDIKGSTPLWEREQEEMAAALQLHNACRV
jgi:class 3 adenylate cyclase